MVIRIEIPFKTPSVNHLYFNWKNRRILTKEARLLKQQIKELVDKQVSLDEYESIAEMGSLAVSVKIYEDWFTKKNTVKRTDIANREKFLIDAVFDALDSDDRYIFEHSMEKVQSEEEEKCVIEISQSV